MVQTNGKIRDLAENSISSNFPESNSRILLLGDPGVGKTSLIYTIINEDFNDDQRLPPKFNDIKIPAKIMPENEGVTIVDYSQRDPTQVDHMVAIREAAVVCILYTSGNHESLDRVAQFWLPKVRIVNVSQEVHRPIILVANKIDLSENANLRDKLNYIKQKFTEVESFLEISALNQCNVIELISTAQKTVIYPLAPLFDQRTRSLTSKCRAALTEIFKLCDRDQDGLMNDHELNLLQESCFGIPLKQDALEDLKNVIRQSATGGIEKNCLTLDGFHFLHALSIDKGRQDFTWEVLRKYNYNNQLNLKLNNSEPSAESTSNTVVTEEESISRLVEETRDHLKIDEQAKISGHELIRQLDIKPWLRDNSRMVKTGLGLTVTTFISFMALKFLIQGATR